MSDAIARAAPLRIPERDAVVQGPEHVQRRPRPELESLWAPKARHMISPTARLKAGSPIGSVPRCQ